MKEALGFISRGPVERREWGGKGEARGREARHKREAL